MALALCLAARGVLAWEQEPAPSVRITYGTETTACPDRESVLARIRAQSDGAPSVEPALELTVERAGEEYVASLRHGHRTRAFRSPRCEVVVDAAAWVAALALVDGPPLHAPDPPAPNVEPAPAPASSSPPPPAARPVVHAPPASGPARDATTPPRTAARDLEVLLAAGTMIGAGYVPNAWPGVSISVGVRGAFWSVALEGRYFPRSPLDVPEVPSGVYVSTAGASLVPCARYAPIVEVAISGCSTMTAGATIGEAADFFDFVPKAEPIFLLGARAGLEARPHERFAVGLTGTIEVALLDTPVAGVDADDVPQTLWLAPLFAGAGGVESIVIF